MKLDNLCSIYKSPKRDEMYLYVPRHKGFAEVPDELRQVFGKPVHVMDLLLKKERPLARADVEQVLADLKEKGFYLQMPPEKEDYMLDLYRPDNVPPY